MNHYLAWTYVTENRWSSFYHQVTEVLSFDPASVLEIGKGGGVVASVLRGRGLTIWTVDVDSLLRPNILASVGRLPMKSASVDVVLCAQVLEHLEFSMFNSCMRELARVARSGVIISLPNAFPFYEVKLAVPLLGRKRISMSRSFGPGPSPNRMNPSHKWEIGRSRIRPEDIIREIGRSECSIIRQYRAQDDPYRHFFVMGKL